MNRNDSRDRFELGLFEARADIHRPSASEMAKHWHDQWVRSEKKAAFLRYVVEKLNGTPGEWT